MACDWKDLECAVHLKEWYRISHRESRAVNEPWLYQLVKEIWTYDE
jgi:hypothetical protein